MDIGFVAGMMAKARADDPGRYEGCVMFSALPDAPVVSHRRGVVHRLRDGVAALRAGGISAARRSRARRPSERGEGLGRSACPDG